MKALMLCLLVGLMTLTHPARAQENTVVVELFTSQGCSSCPPADRLMQKLVHKQNVIVLSLHVDYWDYIGWKDEFADPANTKRQKDYAHAAGRTMIYTPQMIVNGVHDVVGARAMQLADLINEQSQMRRRVEVDLKRSGDNLDIGVMPLTGELEGPFTLELVRFTPERSVDITRGENAGRKLTYVHVVDDWRTLGDWDGKSPRRLSVPVTGDRPAVVFVQAQGPGEIVAAAEID